MNKTPSIFKGPLYIVDLILTAYYLKPAETTTNLHVGDPRVQNIRGKLT